VKIAKYILLTVLINSCNPFSDKKDDVRLYIKEIDSPPVHLNWFFYSWISNISQDFITIENGSEEDTVCVSNNIADLQLVGNTIKIGFYGHPTKYSENINLPASVMNYKIVIDTTFTHVEQIDVRKFYKKPKK